MSVVLHDVRYKVSSFSAYYYCNRKVKTFNIRLPMVCREANLNEV